MDLDRALSFASEHHHGVLLTLRRDGRPQSSNIAYAMDGPVARISVTDDRAKTKNLRRDPRASLHVSAGDFWSYAVLEGTAELSPVAAEPGDETCRLLADVYRGASGEEHPDWDEFHAAMVADRRLVISIHTERAYGMVR
ncbi:MAG: PPOX class F420-dependent oxidoreductase [Actinomycetota bacterium]